MTLQQTLDETSDTFRILLFSLPCLIEFVAQYAALSIRPLQKTRRENFDKKFKRERER
jgi:hypothetical protein